MVATTTAFCGKTSHQRLDAAAVTWDFTRTAFAVFVHGMPEPQLIAFFSLMLSLFSRHRDALPYVVGSTLALALHAWRLRHLLIHSVRSSASLLQRIPCSTDQPSPATEKSIPGTGWFEEPRYKASY